MANKQAFKVSTTTLFGIKFSVPGSGPRRSDKTVNAFKILFYTQPAQVGFGEFEMPSKRPLCNYSGTIRELAVGDTLIGNTIVSREVPSGTKNGVNNVFTLDYTPVLGSEQVYVNGILQSNPDDYTISDNVVTFVTAPASTEIILITYWI
jgi:hypothetical protein